MENNDFRKFRNKWTGNSYILIDEDVKSVTLQRENGTRFEIMKSELNFSYIEIRN